MLPAVGEARPGPFESNGVASPYNAQAVSIQLPEGQDTLPPGRHKATADEIRAAFVEAFPSSARRGPLFDQWMIMCEAIERIVAIEAQWINGSYVTRKEEPGDIDFVSHVDGEAVEQLDPVDDALLKGLVAGEISKALHACDSFVIFIYPAGHPARGAYEGARKYWDTWFGRDRAGNPKGYVELSKQ